MNFKIPKPTLTGILMVLTIALFIGSQVIYGLRYGHWLGLIVFLTIVTIMFAYQWFFKKIL